MVGAGIGVGIATLVEATGSEPADAATFILLPVVLALAGSLIVAVIEGARPHVLRQWVPIDAEAVRSHAIRWYATAGWTPVGGETGMLSFTRRTAPESSTLLVLFLLGIVPGLRYLLVGGRRQTTTILTTSAPDGTGTELEIIVSSKDHGGRPSANLFFNSLHGLVGGGAAGTDQRGVGCWGNGGATTADRAIISTAHEEPSPPGPFSLARAGAPGRG